MFGGSSLAGTGRLTAISSNRFSNYVWQLLRKNLTFGYFTGIDLHHETQTRLCAPGMVMAVSGLERM